MGNSNTRATIPSEYVKTYAVRVTRRNTSDGKHNVESLDYICPDGVPVWTSNNNTIYACRIPTFEAAQRLCRQIFMSPQFPVGCKVQFTEQMHQPELNSDGVYMRKVSDRKLPKATITKPIMNL